MRAVDTNILVRMVVRDNAAQAAAADTFVKDAAWVSLLALAEAVWVLNAVYKRSAAQIAVSLDALLDHKTLTLQEPDVVAQALALFQQRPALGFTDCLMVEIARKAGHLPLGTFDRALATIEGTQRIGA